jgi:hypothetical protein
MSFCKCPSCGEWLAGDDELPIGPCKCHRKPCGTQPTAHNPSSVSFPHLEDVTTEVNMRLNKKHLPWDASAIVAVSETYNIIVGNNTH